MFLRLLAQAFIEVLNEVLLDLHSKINKSEENK